MPRSLISGPILFESVLHYSCAIRQRQFGNSAGRRTCDIKICAVPNAQVADPNAFCVYPDQTKPEKFPPAGIQFGEPVERNDCRSRAFARKLYVLTHGACSGKSEKMLFSFASHTPRSVISPVTRCLGVTSNP